MSYIRWGVEDSDVYLIAYEIGKDVTLLCVGCGLFSFTRSNMIEHLDMHRKVGDTVPESVFCELRLEIDTDGEFLT